jgi:hypothetical protein
MNKIKIILVCLLIPFVISLGLVFLKMKAKGDYQQKTVLAKEIRKALDHLMPDLRQARENTLLGLPADGQWHDRVAFVQGQGVLEYMIKGGQLFRIDHGTGLLIADDIDGLRIRRQKAAPGILEVQIKAQNSVSLISNFKIRTQP